MMVSQLAKDGVIEGYGDTTTFQGNKNITRYEMAQMVANAMAKTNVPSNDKALIDKLSAEFGDELGNLGVRVAKLEKKSDNFKWSGAFMQKYERVYHKGPNHDVSPWYEKEFDLNASATIPGTGWRPASASLRSGAAARRTASTTRPICRIPGTAVIPVPMRTASIRCGSRARSARQASM